MSAEAFVQALHHSQATGTTKVVMLAIANFASEAGAWCAIATLAKIANVSDDNTRKAVRKLEELGEIETERNGGYQLNKPKHTRTNRYEITIQCPEWCDRSMNHRDTRTHKSGPPKSTDPRNRRTDDSAAPRRRFERPLKKRASSYHSRIPFVVFERRRRRAFVICAPRLPPDRCEHSACSGPTFVMSGMPLSSALTR